MLNFQINMIKFFNFITPNVSTYTFIDFSHIPMFCF